MTLRTAFLWTLIISLALAALLGIVAIVLPDLIGADEEILGTAVLLGLHSLPPLACSIVLSRRRFRWAMWLGIVTSPLAWLLWLPLIWSNPWNWSPQFDWEDVLARTGFTLVFVTLWATHLGMITLLRLDRPWFRRVRAGTLVVAALIVLLGVPALWAEYDDDWFLRLLAVLGILGGSGTIVAPVFALLDTMRRRTGRESIDRDLRVRLVCPRCGSEESLRVGPARCTQCGLRIETSIEEPRCPCGYLLFRLEGDRCPECGRRARCACGCLVDDPHGRCPRCGAIIPAESSG